MDIHLCRVHIPVGGKHMSRNGVNKVEQPDEAETQQQCVRCSPRSVEVPDGGSHSPQSLEVESAEVEG